jgi:hypothetical protein
MNMAERGSMISGIAFVISLVVCMVQPLSDLQTGALRTWSHYLGLTATVSVPFLLAFLVFAYFVRRSGRK